MQELGCGYNKQTLFQIHLFLSTFLCALQENLNGT